ncbi:hypothetical protein [Sphingobacterium sp. NPDC055346]
MSISGVTLTKEGSRNITEFIQDKKAKNGIGVQFLHLRCSMTRIVVENRTDSSLIVQNKNALKRDSE